MAEYKLIIADELLATIKGLGFDVDSYFNEVFIKPLLQQHRQELEKVVLRSSKEAIDQKVSEVKAAVSFKEQKKKKTEEITEPAEVEVAEPEVIEPEIAEEPVEPEKI